MPTSVTTGFDPAQHAIDNKGWVNSYVGVGGTVITTFFDTLTLAHAAAQDILSDDPAIHQVFLNAAQTTVLTTNAATVTSTVTTLRTGEGLDGPFP